MLLNRLLHRMVSAMINDYICTRGQQVPACVLWGGAVRCRLIFFGTFNNKLNPDHDSTFSDKERNLLCQILIEMRNDLEKVDGADFNEALSILSKK